MITTVIPVDDGTRVGEVRRAALRLAARAGLDETDAGRVALVASELATNLHLHAREGEILARVVDEHGERGVELASTDAGPGMDVARSMRDGHSTRGSRGVGLGAIARLSTRFDAASWPGIGSFVVSRITVGGAVPSDAEPPGVVCVPHPSEEVSGDAWSVVRDGASIVAAVVDGLGHGMLAADAAREFVRVVGAEAHRSPREILERAQVALRGTRGAAASVVRVTPDARALVHAGIGNVGVSVIDQDARTQRCVSQHGIVGATQARAVVERTYEVAPGALVVLQSDGLSSTCGISRTPGLATRSPALFAAALHRMCRRGRDDATVLALRPSAAMGPERGSSSGR